MKPSLFLTLLCACLLGGCEQKQSNPESAVEVKSTDSRVVKLFDGQAGLQPVVDPLKVEAFRIKSRVFQKDEKPQPFRGYPITAGPVKVDAETTKKLASVLTNPATYGWDFAKGCEFQPGVGIRFTGKSSVTEIVFCFTCDELKVIRDGRSVGGEDFDDARTPLVKIMGRLFPDDAAIGSLKTREELNRIAQVEARQQAARIRHRAKIMPKALIEALVKNDIETFTRELDRAYPNAEDQIRALLYFEGGSNDGWTSYRGVEFGVYQLLHGYEADQLRGPVREALLGTDRALRRGAARFWGSRQSPLMDWSPKDKSKLYSIRLTVMQQARYYPTRQRALSRLEKWGDDLGADEIARRLDAGLHDPHPSVRRMAMIVAGRLQHQPAVPNLMKQLRGEPVTTKPLPKVPAEEAENVPPGFDHIAAQRSEPEVAALALGYLNYRDAAPIIEQKRPDSTMYDVALALLGDVDRLGPEHFHVKERNKELQLAAIAAVVRCKGRGGLQFALEYRQSTHWWEEEYVVNQLAEMLISEQAPGKELLENCSKLKELAAWYEQWGKRYLERFENRSDR